MEPLQVKFVGRPQVTSRKVDKRRLRKYGLQVEATRVVKGKDVALAEKALPTITAIIKRRLDEALPSNPALEEKRVELRYMCNDQLSITAIYFFPAKAPSKTKHIEQLAGQYLWGAELKQIIEDSFAEAKVLMGRAMLAQQFAADLVKAANAEVHRLAEIVDYETSIADLYSRMSGLLVKPDMPIGLNVWKELFPEEQSAIEQVLPEFMKQYVRGALLNLPVQLPQIQDDGVTAWVLDNVDLESIMRRGDT